MAFNYFQGKYQLKNPSKYTGDPSNITFRSSWELAAFKFCDTNPSIIRWNSEEEVIPYRSPVDGRMHRYFMDLKLWTRRADGTIAVTLVEIKPEAQTKPPKKGNKKEERYLKEMATWQVNSAKWAATEQMCKEKGWNFIKWTEKHLVPGVENDAAIKQKMRERKMKRKEAQLEQNQRKRKVAALAKGLKEEIKNRLDA